MAGHPLGLINPALYKMASEHSRGIVSVRSGNTTVSFRQGGRSHTVRGFGARAGYNLAVGLGTVNGRYFVRNWLAWRAAKKGAKRAQIGD